MVIGLPGTLLYMLLVAAASVQPPKLHSISLDGSGWTMEVTNGNYKGTVPATTPCSVYKPLVAAAILPDPNVGTNALHIREVDAQVVVFRKSFVWPATWHSNSASTRIEFDGVDHNATFVRWRLCPIVFRCTPPQKKNPPQPPPVMLMSAGLLMMSYATRF